MQEIWKQSYDVINRANVAIDKISDNPNVSAEFAARLINEAKFIRALLYFNLVRWFGDVPLVLHQPDLSKQNLNVSKSPEADVYESDHF